MKRKRGGRGGEREREKKKVGKSRRAKEKMGQGVWSSSNAGTWEGELEALK